MLNTKEESVNTHLFGLGRLFIYLLNYLDQETVKGPFWSSSQAVTCYY